MYPEYDEGCVQRVIVWPDFLPGIESRHTIVREEGSRMAQDYGWVIAQRGTREEMWFRCSSGTRNKVESSSTVVHGIMYRVPEH